VTDAQRFTLTRWRGQYAHVPLAFGPFLVALPLAFVGVWLDSMDQPAAGTAVTSLGGLIFLAGVLALPTLWRRWRARGRLLLWVEGASARIATPEGAPGGVLTLGPATVARGTFAYQATMRFGGGTYPAPLAALPFPDGPLTIGGEGVAPWDPGAPPSPKPAFVLPAGDWERLIDALGPALGPPDEGARGA